MQPTHCPQRKASPHLKSLILGGLLFLLATGCEDSSHLTVAVEALKAREQKVAAREAEAEQLSKRLANTERELAAARANLETQKAEVEKLKQHFKAEIARAEHIQSLAKDREVRGQAPRITGDRCLVVDALTGDVLFEKNGDKQGQVASTQKLLTALVIVESGDLDKPVTIEEGDIKCPPVRFGLKVGEQYSRRQLLTALLVKSFNDIAQALARDNAGSIEAFAQKMNDRAAALGMANSHFVNPHGLPVENQFATARDMSQVALAVDKLPEVREIISTRSLAFRRADGRFDNLENTNRVLQSCTYCDGMKTGYTDEAGYCLISSGEKDGRRRIVLIFNDDRETIWKDSQAMLDWSLKG